ncbi:unnamed protein product [Urochloa humidicola]
MKAEAKSREAASSRARLRKDDAAPASCAAGETTHISSLCDDLLLEIFLRLPSLATLIRAACTCAAWCRALASSPGFPPPLPHPPPAAPARPLHKRLHRRRIAPPPLRANPPPRSGPGRRRPRRRLLTHLPRPRESPRGDPRWLTSHKQQLPPHKPPPPESRGPIVCRAQPLDSAERTCA